MDIVSTKNKKKVKYIIDVYIESDDTISVANGFPNI